MSAVRRTPRDERRRRLGQNFLGPRLADRLVAEADVRPGELVIDIGAGSGALARALAHRGAEVVAVEVDPVWADRLRDIVQRETHKRIRVVNVDFLAFDFPSQPFRVVGCLPFGATTAILRRLLDQPRQPLLRADLIVQWEVARKRATVPPSTLISTTWAPWWEFRLGWRIPASEFRPVPDVDGGVLVITRREPPLLPPAMARPYTDFVRTHWPFQTEPR